jgi:D-tyrosyl-tRNA(Tyr) deacylase
MRVLVQRVSEAAVSIEGKKHASIGQGLLVFLGVESSDEQEDAIWLARKISTLRIFDDGMQMMNLSANEIKAQVLVISQFTLHAKTKKGNRPSYIRAANPDHAIPLYEFFIDCLHDNIKGSVRSGVFGATMKVSLVNEGPVTIWIDSKTKE